MAELEDVEREVDVQFDGAGGEFLDEYAGLGVVKHGGMPPHDAEEQRLCLRDIGVVPNAHGKVESCFGVAREVANRTLVDGRIGDLNVVSVVRHEDGSAGGYLLDNSGVSGDFDGVANAKRFLNANQQACQKVLGDIPEGESDDESHDSRAAEHGDGEPR